MPRSVVDGGVRSARRNSRVSAAAMAVCRDTITLSAPDLHPGRQVVRIMGYSETSRKETCRDISGLQFSEDDVNRIVLSVFVDLRPLVRSWPKQTNRTWQLPTINTWIAASSGDNRGMQATTSKVWLITGSSRGLGRAFTEAALEAGHRVVATARDPQQLGTIVGKYGDRVRAVALDVTNEAQAQQAIHAAIEAFGGLDVLVNNAGYGNVCSVEDTSLNDFRAQIETNLFGVIIMTKAALPYFRERRAGHIIQITSIGGRIAPIGRAAYAAAKFGVEGFSESLFKEVGPLGIKVTLVEPGGFRTDFAGSSTSLCEGRSEYDATVGATVRFQRDYDGKQPGDPAKAAAALLHIASLSEPPLRLLLGSDSYNAAEQAALQKLELDRNWKDLSISTDYSSDDVSATLSHR